MRAEASGMFEQILPVLLRFLGDGYDDTSSVVFPVLQCILNRVSPTLLLARASHIGIF